MKFTIITVCLNSEKTILYTLNSLINQTYKNIEHIIVDGGSKDKTLTFIKKYNFKNKKVIMTNLKGIYNAINLGIKHATGEYIGILHSDDIYQNNKTIEEISKIIEKNRKYKIFFGNVLFFKNSFSKIIRYYPGNKFKRNDLKKGLMPPHTSSFIHKDVFKKIGLYKNHYIIAGDFDFFLRAIFIHKIKFLKIDKLIIRMKTGGTSGKNIFAYFISSLEIVRSLRENRVNCNKIYIYLRLLLKLFQFFNFNTKKLNKSFQLRYSEFLNKFQKSDLKIIQTLDKFSFNENFILSALNLSFLGSYIKGEIKIKKNLICWPDGHFAKIIDSTLYKVPGRDLIRNLKLPKTIKKIIVFGNLTIKSKNLLQQKFKIKIIHRPLFYGNINLIIKNVNCFIKINHLVLITLPTPKQEIFAQHLAKLNKNYKIICIGGSISIFSGEEKPVPSSLVYLEFLWRLRYETSRRLLRLLKTFKYFVYGKFFTRQLELKKIERL